MKYDEMKNVFISYFYYDSFDVDIDVNYFMYTVEKINIKSTINYFIYKQEYKIILKEFIILNKQLCFFM
jgi:hypothetical protein